MCVSPSHDPHASSSSLEAVQGGRWGLPKPPQLYKGVPLPCLLPEGFNALYKPHRCPVPGLCRALAECAISSLFCRCIFGSLDCQDLMFISVPQLSHRRPGQALGALNASGIG